MKVLHFLWALDNGGAENLVVDIANEQAVFHDVTLVVANNRIDSIVRDRLSPNVRLMELGRQPSTRSLLFFLRLLLGFLKASPDVVHVHSPNAFFLRLVSFCPVILTVHDVNVRLGPLPSLFKRICCISEAVFNDVSVRYSHLGVVRVDNGISVSSISTKRNGSRSSGKVIRLVQVSRLVHQKKGQDVLLKAISIVNSRNQSYKVVVDFFGDGPSKPFLLGLADELGVQDCCEFLGSVTRSDLYTSLCSYDALVQPSIYEGFGLTVIEAMAAELPVIVSDIDGPMELVGNGEFGYHFSSGDPNSLAEKIESFVRDLRSAKCLERVAKAKDRVLEKYDIGITVRKYDDLYKEVADA